MEKPAREWIRWQNVRPITAGIGYLARRKALPRMNGHVRLHCERWMSWSEDWPPRAWLRHSRSKRLVSGNWRSHSIQESASHVFFKKEALVPDSVTAAWQELAHPGGRNDHRQDRCSGSQCQGNGYRPVVQRKRLDGPMEGLQPEIVADGLKRLSSNYRALVERCELDAWEMRRGLARVHPTTEYTGFWELRFCG